MLKRLLGLSFLCLGLCLLLFLAADKTDAPPQAPVRTQAFYALPVRPAPDQTDSKPQNADDQPRVLCPAVAPALAKQIPDCLSLDRPFHLRYFFAFHYSSEAG